MKYFEAPNFDLNAHIADDFHSLFLGGTISGTGDWQTELIFKEVVVVDMFFTGSYCVKDIFNIFNPRRAFFEKTLLNDEEQIAWEFHAIKKCKNILFWFAAETVAPIALFEFGKVLKTHDHNRIFIGVHPDYPRKDDVIIQTRLENPDLAERIVFSLDSLAENVVRVGHSFARDTEY